MRNSTTARFFFISNNNLLLTNCKRVYLSIKNFVHKMFSGLSLDCPGKVSPGHLTIKNNFLETICKVKLLFKCILLFYLNIFKSKIKKFWQLNCHSIYAVKNVSEWKIAIKMLSNPSSYKFSLYYKYIVKCFTLNYWK